MLATFEPNGNFWIDGSESQEYVHGIDLDNPDEAGVLMLWRSVQNFYESLLESGLPPGDIWVYGTELCRRLASESQRVPAYVTVLGSDLEAIMSWATGFLKARNGIDGWTYTIFDQGGGSSELVSGVWNGKTNRIDRLVYETFDLGHKKLAKLYSPSSPTLYVNELRNMLERQSDRISLHETGGRMGTLILLGSSATKLAFNIKHKRDHEHTYSAREVDVTTVTVAEIQAYYNERAKEYKVDPLRARRMVDKRMVDTDEYERVMSGAILLMLLSTRLGYQKLTVTASSTRYGFGFLIARRLIANRSSG